MCVGKHVLRVFKESNQSDNAGRISSVYLQFWFDTQLPVWLPLISCCLPYPWEVYPKTPSGQLGPQLLPVILVLIQDRKMSDTKKTGLFGSVLEVQWY